MGWQDSAVEPLKQKRRRGVVLTPFGLKRLQSAILAVELAENQGDRFTLEELGDRISVSPKTLSRLWSLSASVDQRTLKLCFGAFGLDLRPEDYTTLKESAKEPEKEPESEALSSPPPPDPIDAIASIASMPYPDGPVPLGSPFYVERPPIEMLAYQELLQPGSVIRIRAPREMGKSSLVLRLLTFAAQRGYRTVNLDCNQFDAAALFDLSKFLRSFCLRLASELGIPPQLNHYWDDEIGSKLSCSLYLKTYLLEQVSSPVVLVFNEIDRFFEYPQFAQEFFPLLRSWYEEARLNPNLQKLRLVVVYSTEEYVALNINRSPFNIGLPLRLPEFTPAQVYDLADRHGLAWQAGGEVAELMSVVGGHPALVRVALYHICRQGMSLKQLLQDAIAKGGVFQSHLWRHWVTVQKDPTSVEALSQVIRASQSVSLDPMQAYKLESQGLICYDGDRFKPRCELYRAYFLQQLAAQGQQPFPNYSTYNAV